MEPRLAFGKSQIPKLAERYEYRLDDQTLEELAPMVRKRGLLTKEELRKVAYWKSPRSSGHARKNDEGFVVEITGFALSTKCERARVESLTLLDGVSYPSASVILHFFHADPYPILDYGALDAISLEVPNEYKFGFWWTYVEFCRKLAKEAGVDMRTLDRALWQYSKERTS